MNKLSHSSVSRFQMCPKSFDYHYNKRIRPKVTHAALLFGSAIDAALTALLKGEGSPEDIFESSFTYAKINDIEEYLPTCTKLVYSNSDFDSDLLLEEDYKFIEKLTKGKFIGREVCLDNYSNIESKKKELGLEVCSDNERSLYNVMNWCCLLSKGHLMIDAYRRKVIPKIESVLSTQERITLSNGDGDEVIGYVDLIAVVKDIGVVILDNKTSGLEYKEDSVISSPQLSLYLHALEEKYNTRKAGFIVMNKRVIKNRKKICSVCGHDGSGGRHKTCDAIIEGKRCNGAWNETIDPDIFIQFITDEIPKATEELVLENIDDINQSIKTKHFTRNLTSCLNWYGGRCPYFGLCYKGDMHDLLEVKK